mmetsp:Transcript_37062/g.59559  ORF Transcript_37062/g.59559 Transcript_37062/m.59559 type:complete len:239 (-) Transcript_37062:415-1131(-)
MADLAQYEQELLRRNAALEERAAASVARAKAVVDGSDAAAVAFKAQAGVERTTEVEEGIHEGVPYVHAVSGGGVGLNAGINYGQTVFGDAGDVGFNAPPTPPHEPPQTAAAAAVAAMAAAAHASTVMLRCAASESGHIEVCCAHRSSSTARLGIAPESMEASKASTPRRRLGIFDTVTSRNLPTAAIMRSPGDVYRYRDERRTVVPASAAASSARSTCGCSDTSRHVSWSRNCRIPRC